MGSVVIWGLGELGGLFSHGFLRVGHSVVPVRREDAPGEVAAHIPEPVCVLVAVGEAELDSVLKGMPPTWRDRVVLVQNELTPSAWTPYGLQDPTVGVVWFEKKRGRPVRVLQDTRFAGPAAPLLVRALVEVQVGATPVRRSDLTMELAAKNAWILTLNVGGLMLEQRERAGPVLAGDFLGTHHEAASALSRELIQLQRALFGVSSEEPSWDEEALLRRVFDAFEAHPEQFAVGRSAPARLARAVANAGRLGVHAPVLMGLAETRDVEVP